MWGCAIASFYILYINRYTYIRTDRQTDIPTDRRVQPCRGSRPGVASLPKMKILLCPPINREASDFALVIFAFAPQFAPRFFRKYRW